VGPVAEVTNVFRLTKGTEDSAKLGDRVVALFIDALNKPVLDLELDGNKDNYLDLSKAPIHVAGEDYDYELVVDAEKKYIGVTINGELVYAKEGIEGIIPHDHLSFFASDDFHAPANVILSDMDLDDTFRHPDEIGCTENNSVGIFGTDEGAKPL